jgi:hypothetical protein
MTVAQLIAELQNIDPETRVFVRGYEGGVDDMVENSLSVRDIALNVHDSEDTWWYGRHDAPYQEHYYLTKTIVKGIVI